MKQIRQRFQMRKKLTENIIQWVSKRTNTISHMIKVTFLCRLSFSFEFCFFFFHLESYEFRNCLEACEIYQGNELKPDHNCIRKKCLKEITGIWKLDTNEIDSQLINLAPVFERFLLTYFIWNIISKSIENNQWE